ncbi:hypothetical protein R1sor_026587 [Riccia sorocarpa]|uniref:Uncharacterized protein n=1 Tax=Riccia sorocarpa TaxID=122646 RepID=A0ABD3GHH6_9MARC
MVEVSDSKNPEKYLKDRFWILSCWPSGSALCRSGLWGLDFIILDFGVWILPFWPLGSGFYRFGLWGLDFIILDFEYFGFDVITFWFMLIDDRSGPVYANLMEWADTQMDIKVPQWNFHLAVHDGTMFVAVFDSLISRDAFSGQFSAFIPEVKAIDAELVRLILELKDVPAHYLPTKVVAQNEMCYVVFEYDGVCGVEFERGQNPLYVFAYDTRQCRLRWLPVLDTKLSRREFLPLDCRFNWLREIYTFAASFRAFV